MPNVTLPLKVITLGSLYINIIRLGGQNEFNISMVYNSNHTSHFSSCSGDENLEETNGESKTLEKLKIEVDSLNWELSAWH